MRKCPVFSQSEDALARVGEIYGKIGLGKCRQSQSDVFREICNDENRVAGSLHDRIAFTCKTGKREAVIQLKSDFNVRET